MNPDFQSYKTAESTTWTIIKGNRTISFKMYNGRETIIIEDNGETNTYLIKAGRNMWNEFMRQGFRVSNECVEHDMKKFHKAYREMEEAKAHKSKKYGIYNAVEDGYKNIDINIHHAELYEARINPKKFYNYALEA